MAKKTDGEGGGVTPALANTEDPKNTISALGLALNEFVRINPHMPVAQIVAFLLVAMDSDLSLQEIQNRTCLKKSTSSKLMIELGTARIEGDKTYGLIERLTSRTSAREARFQLTRSGKAMVGRVLKALERRVAE